MIEDIVAKGNIQTKDKGHLKSRRKNSQILLLKLDIPTTGLYTKAEQTSNEPVERDLTILHSI